MTAKGTWDACSVLPFRAPVYVPPPAQGYERFAETRPRKRPKDPLVIFWTGFAWGMATLGVLIAALLP